MVSFGTYRRTNRSSVASKAAARAGSIRSREKPLRASKLVTYAANGCVNAA